MTSVILTCGFEAITHNLVFSNGVAIREGQQMANSGKHLHQMKEQNRQVTAFCWPSGKQAIGKAYKIKLKVFSTNASWSII